MVSIMLEELKAIKIIDFILIILSFTIIIIIMAINLTFIIPFT
jgi:hypothetical protein